MEPTNVIIKPLVTEKTTWQAGRFNAYVFQVAPDANKHTVKAAIESLYDVKVADVRTQVRKGKVKRNKFGRVKKSDVKRAIVCLAEGQALDLF